MAFTVRNSRVAQRSAVFVDSKQGWGRMYLFLAVGLVVENHVSRAAPEVCANRCQSHVWWTELGKELVEDYRDQAV